MGDVVSLSLLARRVTQEHQMMRVNATLALAAAREAGQALIDAEAQLGHTAWLSWLAAYCRLAPTTADVYMEIARHQPEIDATAQRVADLPVREAIRLLSRQDTAPTTTPVQFPSRPVDRETEAVFRFLRAEILAAQSSPDAQEKRKRARNASRSRG